MKVKTVDVNAKEWFDKVNGNSYFSAEIIINYSMKTEKTIYLPFQYGYGDHYRHEAFQALQDNKIVPIQEGNISYWRYYKNNNIIARHSIKENCLKREL